MPSLPGSRGRCGRSTCAALPGKPRRRPPVPVPRGLPRGSGRRSRRCRSLGQLTFLPEPVRGARVPPALGGAGTRRRAETFVFLQLPPGKSGAASCPLPPRRAHCVQHRAAPSSFGRLGGEPPWEPGRAGSSRKAEPTFPSLAVEAEHGTWLDGARRGGRQSRSLSIRLSLRPVGAGTGAVVCGTPGSCSRLWMVTGRLSNDLPGASRLAKSPRVRARL